MSLTLFHLLSIWTSNISFNVYRGEYIARVEQWSTVPCHRAREWSPIFFSARLSLQGWVVFYVSQLVGLTSPLPPPENKHVSHVEEERKRRWWEWKSPKRGLCSLFRSLCKVAPPSPLFLYLPFRHKCFPFVFAPTRYRFAGAFHFAAISRRREEASGGILIQDRKFTAS